MITPNFLLDHHRLGGGQAGVCAEGRDRRKRLDPLGGGRWTSSGEKTSGSAMNINACNLDTLIHTSHASQHHVCGEYICVWLMNQPNSSRCSRVVCAQWEARAHCLNTQWKCEGFFFLPPPAFKLIIIFLHQALFQTNLLKGRKGRLKCYSLCAAPAHPRPSSMIEAWWIINQLLFIV